MGNSSNNKTIAKNSLALYFRMALTMVVGLYTSRVILQILGVTDMGIHASVGGLVSFVAFLNTALGNGTSRFLTFELGKGNIDKLKRTFSTCFLVHLGLGVTLAIGIEIIGSWFLYNKLLIPADRMNAAEWVFHLGVISMIVNMTQIPYQASIIAHEEMGIFAYASIADVILKLIIVYMLMIFDFDKLKLYSILFFVVTVGMRLFYRWYCKQHFEECEVQIHFDKAIFKPIAKFSGWQLFSQGAIALKNQGILVLLNMFFPPAVVAARSISLQLNNHIIQFMTNFRTAANPQIVKKYALGDLEGSKKLLLESTRFCYFMMLFMVLPLFLLSYEVLMLWLGQVPEYTDIFLKLVLIQSLFQVFDTGLYTAIYANGNIKWNALTGPMITFCAFPVVYYLFKMNYSPVALSWMFIIVYCILGCIQKPILIVKVCGYKYSDFLPMYWSCLKVTILSVILPITTDLLIRQHTTNMGYIIISVLCVSVLSISLCSWYFGINKEMRDKLVRIFMNKVVKRIKKNKNYIV